MQKTPLSSRAPGAIKCLYWVPVNVVVASALGLGGKGFTESGDDYNGHAPYLFSHSYHNLFTPGIRAQLSSSLSKQRCHQEACGGLKRWQVSRIWDSHVPEVL